MTLIFISDLPLHTLLLVLATRIFLAIYCGCLAIAFSQQVRVQYRQRELSSGGLFWLADKSFEQINQLLACGGGTISS